MTHVTSKVTHVSTYLTHRLSRYSTHRLSPIVAHPALLQTARGFAPHLRREQASTLGLLPEERREFLAQHLLDSGECEDESRLIPERLVVVQDIDAVE